MKRKSRDSAEMAKEIISRCVPQPNGCMIWPGALRLGYGVVRRGTRLMPTHRIVLAAYLGRELLPGECSLHRCDVRACNNPDHLFAGTKTDNNRDRDAKGRQARGDRNGSRTHPERLKRGDSNGSRLYPERLMRGDSHWTRTTPEKVTRGTRVNTAKLTEEKVREIRLRVAAGQKQTSVAREFGVRNTNVSAIVRRETWKHVA